jgi:hypothetical protein
MFFWCFGRGDPGTTQEQPRSNPGATREQPGSNPGATREHPGTPWKQKWKKPRFFVVLVVAARDQPGNTREPTGEQSGSNPGATRGATREHPGTPWKQKWKKLRFFDVLVVATRDQPGNTREHLGTNREQPGENSEKTMKSGKILKIAWKSWKNKEIIQKTKNLWKSTQNLENPGKSAKLKQNQWNSWKVRKSQKSRKIQAQPGKIRKVWLEDGPGQLTRHRYVEHCQHVHVQTNS